jgi:signal peptidase I
MAPTVQSGERLIATPLAFGPRTIFGRLPGLGRPEHGDIVVVEPNYVRREGFWGMLADAFVRFATFQLVSIARSGADGMLSAPTLQRVVGVPGDTIRMDDFVFKVKAAGSEQFLTEFELSTSRYDISRDKVPDLWRSDLPGSGQMAELTLGPDQYFLAGDSRSSSSDSRLWGPVGIDRFRAKVILRYWPPHRFGIP